MTRPPFSLAFSGGTVVDALNSILRCARAIEWDAAIIEHPTNWHETDPVAVVGVLISPRAPGITSGSRRAVSHSVGKHRRPALNRLLSRALAVLLDHCSAAC